jgi:hypothetical protein
MRTLAYRSIALACVAAATACGALASTGSNGSPVDASATLDASVALDATAADAKGPREAGDPRDAADLDIAADAPLLCPPMLPESGAPCSPPPSVVDSDGPYEIFWQCEYGSDPHCRALAACFSNGAEGDTWTVSQPDPSCAGNPPACPANFDDGVGMDCPVQGSCTYPEGRCSCVRCGVPDSGPPVPAWSCTKFDEPNGCPEPRPLLGSPCTSVGHECAYGPPCCTLIDVGPTMVCVGDYWAALNSICSCPPELACTK